MGAVLGRDGGIDCERLGLGPTRGGADSSICSITGAGAAGGCGRCTCGSSSRKNWDCVNSLGRVHMCNTTLLL